MLSENTFSDIGVYRTSVEYTHFFFLSLGVHVARIALARSAISCGVGVGTRAAILPPSRV